MLLEELYFGGFVEEKKKKNLEKNIAELLSGIPRIQYQHAFLRLLLSLLKLKKLKKTRYASAVIRVARKVEVLFSKKTPAWEKWQKSALQKCRSIALGIFSSYLEEEAREAILIISGILPGIYTDMRVYIARGMRRKVWSNTVDFNDCMEDENKWISLVTKDALQMFRVGDFKLFLVKGGEKNMREAFFSTMKEYLLQRNFSSIVISPDGYLLAERLGKIFAAISSVEGNYLVISVKEEITVSP